MCIDGARDTSEGETGRGTDENMRNAIYKHCLYESSITTSIIPPLSVPCSISVPPLDSLTYVTIYSSEIDRTKGIFEGTYPVDAGGAAVVPVVPTGPP